MCIVTHTQGMECVKADLDRQRCFKELHGGLLFDAALFPHIERPAVEVAEVM